MKIIAGNWKMNKTNAETEKFFDEFWKLVDEPPNKVIICAPFTSLATAYSMCEDSGIEIGAQNVHHERGGTFTGEISADMLLELGVKYVLAGHSERRAMLGETDEFINQKVKSAINAGLHVILCIGETLDELSAGKTFDVLKRQLEKGLAGVGNTKNIYIAYESVWAISGGDPNKPKPIATTDQIATVHAFIKNIINVPVLYGGSANDQNMHEIFSIPNVDGALIGGASLVPEKFAKMVSWSTTNSKKPC